MSHTNSTTNYNLPQFIGTDKPTWLNDVNGAFSAIDAQMKLNADSATSAGTSATTANNAIGTLANLETTAKTDLVSAVNEVNTTAGTALNVANSAGGTAGATATDLANFIAKFNINASSSNANVQVTRGAIAKNPTLSQNSDGSMFKFYGTLQINAFSSTSGASVTFTAIAGMTGYKGFATGCYLTTAPTVAYVIKGAGDNTLHNQADTQVQARSVTDIAVGTDGQIYIFPQQTTANSYDMSSGTYRLMWFPPCLYFNENFGDTPTPE